MEPLVKMGKKEMAKKAALKKESESLRFSNLPPPHPLFFGSPSSPGLLIHPVTRGHTVQPPPPKKKKSYLLL